MKRKITGLSERYFAAVKTHLKQGPGATLQPALKLGRQAGERGLETLDLARIHEQALVTLELHGSKTSLRKRARKFFAEASTPIEETQRSARQAKAHVNQLKKTLGRRTGELAASHRQLKLDTAQRKSMEGAHARSGAHHKKCLRESLKLQQRLRQLTHRVLAAQESERTKISHELQDEIAQTLLGINVRLLSLKKEAWSAPNGRMNQIASFQPPAVNPVNSGWRFGHGSDLHLPMQCD